MSNATGKPKVLKNGKVNRTMRAGRKPRRTLHLVAVPSKAPVSAEQVARQTRSIANLLVLLVNDARSDGTLVVDEQGVLRPNPNSRGNA